MMGVIFLLCGIGGLVISGLLGFIGVMIHRKAMAAGSGSWLLFWLIAGVIALVAIGVGVTCLTNARGGAPRAEDYANVMKAMFFFGVAPGAGMLAGALAAVFK